MDTIGLILKIKTLIGYIPLFPGLRYGCTFTGFTSTGFTGNKMTFTAGTTDR